MTSREFVLSDWYYRDPERCPHDAWLESCEIFENFTEITLGSSGNVVHETYFRSGCVWKIEARTVSYLFEAMPGKHLAAGIAGSGGK
jgi:hypothetical protein